MVSLACLSRKSSGSLRPANTPVVMVTQPTLTSRPVSTPAAVVVVSPAAAVVVVAAAVVVGPRCRRGGLFGAAAGGDQAAQAAGHADGRTGDAGDLQKLTPRNRLSLMRNPLVASARSRAPSDPCLVHRLAPYCTDSPCYLLRTPRWHPSLAWIGRRLLQRISPAPPGPRGTP